MRNLKALMLLAAVTVVILLAAIFYRPNPITQPQLSAGPLLPGLAKQLDKVEVVAIVHAGERVTLQHKNGAWTVAEKANYPASDEQVRALLLGLAQIQKIESKTRNPKYYSNLGLTDADKSGGEASQLDLKDQSGHVLAQLTIGKRRPATENTQRNEFYAMLQNDPQTWLVAGNMPTIGAAGAWLKRTLIELERPRIVNVTLTHSDGEVLHLIPKEPGKLSMTLEGLKADETFKNDYALDDIVDRFTRMQFEDTRPIDQLKWPAKPDLQVEARTKDGLIVRINAAKIDGQSWLQLAASAAPNNSDEPTTAKTQATGTTMPAQTVPNTQKAVPPGEKAVTTSTVAKHEEPTKNTKTLQQEIATLNARWHGWAYTLADWAYQALDKHRADLVKSTAKSEPLPTANKVTPPVQNEHTHAPATTSGTEAKSPQPEATEATESEPPNHILDDGAPIGPPASTEPPTTATPQVPAPAVKVPAVTPKPVTN